MIAPVTQPTRRFQVGKSLKSGWTVLDMEKRSILKCWFESFKDAQQLADQLEQEAKHEN